MMNIFYSRKNEFLVRYLTRFYSITHVTHKIRSTKIFVVIIHFNI